MDGAAVRLQTLWRGFHTRATVDSELERVDGRVVSMQALWRSVLVRQRTARGVATVQPEAAAQVQAAAAARVQAAYRGRLARDVEGPCNLP